MSIAGNELQAHGADVELLTGLGNDMLMPLIVCLPRGIERCCGKSELARRRVGRRFFAVGAVIDEGTDRELGEQRLKAAQMIQVIVSHEEVVNLANAERCGGGGDAICTRRHGRRGWSTRSRTWATNARRPPGVDQQRLTFRGDE